MSKLPAGLMDKNVEIFEHEGRAWALYNGERMPFHRMPQDIYNAFFEEMLRDKEAMKALDTMLDKSFSNKFNQFLICRYGALDSTPDLDTSKVNFTPEYHECGNRNNCPFSFVLCDRVIIKTDKGDIHLTRKEVEIVKLIASGLTDKETADQAKIALNTLLTHKKNIYSKLGIQSNVQLTLLAVHNNLIQ